jgi:rhodanese-related sulfurtransferase
MKAHWIIAAAGIAIASAAHAGKQPLAEDELASLLRESPSCCVIDARTARQREREPIEGAVIYRQGVVINPTATVVVVSHSDTEASRVVAALEQKYPGKLIVAAKGGYATWKAATTNAAQPAQDAGFSSAKLPGSRFQFVIPHNTFEVGQPLQILQSKPQ